MTATWSSALPTALTRSTTAPRPDPTPFRIDSLVMATAEPHAEREVYYLGWNSATSTLSPGPKPSATQGPSAPLSIRRFRMNSTVADDMLPYSDRISREAQTASVGNPSTAAAESRIFGPPGWIAHDFTSATR